MDNIKETLLEYALYEYYSALAANLPPVGVAALLKDGKIISAGPTFYTGRHIETAQQSFNTQLAAHYYRDHKGDFPSIDEVLKAFLSVRPDPKNYDEYIINFHMEP